MNDFDYSKATPTSVTWDVRSLGGGRIEILIAGDNGSKVLLQCTTVEAKAIHAALGKAISFALVEEER